MEFCRSKFIVLKSALPTTPQEKHSHKVQEGSSSTLLLFLLLFLSWADSPDPDGGVSLLPVPPAAAYGNRDSELLPNRQKSRIGLTLNWVESTISISTRGAEKPALICGGNVNHFTIRARESTAHLHLVSFFFTNYHSQSQKYEQELKLKSCSGLGECDNAKMIDFMCQ